MASSANFTVLEDARPADRCAATCRPRRADRGGGVEELIAFGVQRFVSIGLAGGLQSDLHPGDIVIADRALRDEGTSYHYLPPARSVEADPALVQQISAALSAQHVVHSIGASWTTDAPYRETRRKVETYRAEGVKTVEMEAAAAVCRGPAAGRVDSRRLGHRRSVG